MKGEERMPANSEFLPLSGLTGDNPLAFLAAVGTLRILSRVWPDRNVRVAWRVMRGWHPIVCVDGEPSADDVVAALSTGLAGHGEAPEFNTLGPDLPAPAKTFVGLARAARQCQDRTTADYCASYGSEAYVDDDDLIEDTALRTMSGAGHQHFLEFMREIVQGTTSDQLRAALFTAWTYSDPRPSMRWDPQDDRRYALRASDPAGGQSPITTVRGANCLAIEALPCFPTVPTRREVRTLAFRGTTFSWPLWNVPITLECLKSLLGHAQLTQERPSQIALRPLGVVEVFRSRRVTTGRFRNFTTSVACWGHLPTE